MNWEQAKGAIRQAFLTGSVRLLVKHGVTTPHAIGKSKDGFHSFNPHVVAAVTHNAVIEVADDLEAAKKLIAELIARVAALEGVK